MEVSWTWFQAILRPGFPLHTASIGEYLHCKYLIFLMIRQFKQLRQLSFRNITSEKMSILVWFLLMMFPRIPQFPEGSSGRTDHWKKFFCMGRKKPFPYSRIHGNIYLHWMLHVWSSDEKSKYTSINIQIPSHGPCGVDEDLPRCSMGLENLPTFGSNLCLKCRLKTSIQSMEHLGWRFCGIRWHPSWKAP